MMRVKHGTPLARGRPSFWTSPHLFFLDIGTQAAKKTRVTAETICPGSTAGVHAVAIGGLKCGKFMPILPLAPVLLVLGLSAGCENQLPAYPADLPYPARTDPLVTEQLAEIPGKPDDPGQLATILTSLKDAKD